ncbi:23S rRNA (adenine(2503)-C(2))-methyltransferase RlmN [Candidatus Babeliales bacterium]|nr:23S rRNA (adenine(2503)-C(2))-methyltransferase RlmN [Candidatus Babeliales bacterium]
MKKENLLDLNLEELKQKIKELGHEPYRAKQLFEWIYKKNIFDINKYSNIPQKLKDDLTKNFTIQIPEISHVSHSEKDNSYKFLLKTDDDKLVESILMLKNDRATICISCMIGCPLACKFCATGMEVGFVRKLKTSEIIGQILAIKSYAKLHSITDKITNIVFMGMGEPFLNLPAVDRTVGILISEDGFGMSKSRITISTAGPTNNIADFINKHKVKLAVSLHFPTDELRSKYMPVNKNFDLSQLVEELKKIKLSKREQITIEYMMLQNINDSIEHAKQLVRLVSSLKVKINLIPYNPTKALPVKPSDEKTINEFIKYLVSKSVPVTVRRSLGAEIEGACGQFALKKTS